MSRVDNSDKNNPELLFKELYREYYYKSLFYANQYLKDIESSKEIVQESFMALWERRYEIDFGANPGAYLIKTIRNKSLNFIRDRLKRETEISGERRFDLLISSKALAEDASDFTTGNELSTLIRDTIDSMPNKISTVFRMNRDLEMTYPEIAKSMNISQKTVEYRMSKALSIFRKALKDFLIIVLFLG